MAVVGSNLTSGYDNDGGNSSTTASITPTSNNLILLTVASMTSISTNPNQPTASGNGLTWEVVNSIVFLTTGTDRMRITTLRTMGASPSSGVVTISFGGQNQVGVQWGIEQFSGIDTSGSNGSGAIVQSVSAKDETPPITMTITLAAFSSIDNATFGGFAAWSDEVTTAGSGFTKLTDQRQALVYPLVMTEWKSTNDTTVDWSTNDTAEMGGVAIEIKAAAASAIKSFNGLAYASTKTVNGLSVASIKSWNGLQ